MLADIASGEVDTADVFFLIAVILAALAAVLYAVATRPVVTTQEGVRRANPAPWAPVALSLALGFAAAGFLVL